MRYLAFILLLLTPSLGFAQQTVELTDVQRAYNEDGIKLSVEGRYSEALARFQNSLTLGEANVTWLNIGRTYQKMDECLKAKEAYAKVETAPAVASPPPADVLKFLQSYTAELPATCPASITVECDGGEARINAGGWAPCPATVKDLSAGDVTVDVRWDKVEQTRKMSLAEGQTLATTFQRPQPVADEPPAETVVQPSSPPRVSNTLPLVVAGVGAGILATSLILDATVVRSAVETYQDSDRDEALWENAANAQLMNRIVIGTGTVVIVAGVVWWLFEPTVESQPVIGIGADVTTWGWMWLW